MKVYLAGYNVDTQVLSELEEKTGKRGDLTPEVLSAAYARISRDPRPINEIRKEAREEVEKSRRSNSTIIFKMGHHSVAEHAVFNLDLIGVSRFAMEEVEKFRLCSYTEKSQRYVTLDKDHVVPEAIKGTPLEKKFTDMVHRQNEAYFELLEKLKEHVFSKHSDLAADPKKHNMLEGWAKEDARYITALATESQVGLTINARNLELMLRRFASNTLEEVRTLGKTIFEQIAEVAPSIIIFNEANPRDLNTYPELRKTVSGFTDKIEPNDSFPDGEEVSLVEYTEDADDIIAASLIHVSEGLSYQQCKFIVKNMSVNEKEGLFKAAWRNMQFYDSMLREFEYVNLTYNVVLSSACFGQLKRHRMSTITSQEYDPSLGLTIPENIKEIQMEGYFTDVASRTNEVYDEIKKEVPGVAPYILTNAHRKRILIRLNARELYHVSRLREDAHAQWDIQNVSRDMAEKAKKVMPLTLGFIGGKDRFNDIYQNIFGALPKVTEAVLPGSRTIK